MYSQESLVNKNTYIKIKALGLTTGKILARLKFIEKICHGHFGKDVSTLGKVLSQEILKWNIKVLPLYAWGQGQRVIKVPKERSCH